MAVVSQVLSQLDTAKILGKFSFLQEQWVLVSTAATFILALAFPWPGAFLYLHTKNLLVVLLFALVGCSIKLKSFKDGLRALHIHIFCQGFNLVALPFLYYALFYQSGFDSKLLGTSVFSKGILISLCMPMPSTTGVIFTELAGGDVSVAVINAALGNILGPVVAPVTIGLLIADESFQNSLGNKAITLACRIIIPLVGGIISRHLVSQRSEALERKLKSGSSLLLKGLLLLLFYMLFCEGIKKTPMEIPMVLIIRVLLWITCVHILAFLTIWAVSGALGIDIQRRIAVAIMGSQKTEGKAFAIISVLFHGSSDLGMIMLPVIAYHSIQMLVSGIVAKQLRRISSNHVKLPGQRLS